MPLDHHTTARQLDQDASIIHTLRERCCRTVGEKRAASQIIDHLLGLADWHRSQAPDDRQELTPENLAAAAKKALTPAAMPATLIGKSVQAVTGPFKGAQGTICGEHPDGSLDVDLGAGNTFSHARPGADVALIATAQ